jgi:hypothetical protein
MVTIMKGIRLLLIILFILFTAATMLATACGPTLDTQIFCQVCQGQGTGVPQAAAYQGDTHPVVLLDHHGNEHEWSDDLPREWLPTAVEETQLVVCVGVQKINTIEVCQYIGGPAITRYRYSVDVTLREAMTAELVASTTLWGSSPRHCKATESASLTRLEGSLVSFVQLKVWLREQLLSPVAE